MGTNREYAGKEEYIRKEKYKEYYGARKNLLDAFEEYQSKKDSSPKSGLGREVVDEMLKGWGLPEIPPPAPPPKPKAPQDLDF
jgi:hypothetical protein